MQPNPTSNRSLQVHFQQIPDPRTGPAKRHELLDILLIAVCSMLCGAESFADMELFGHCQYGWLKSWLSLPHGIPSHDTFNRVFALIDPKAFRDCFVSWTQSLRRAIAEEIIAIDGKTLRRSQARGRGPLHLVNVWATQNRLILGQWKVEEKSNEITALPVLLRALELSGCIVTVDALHCQKQIAKEISEADADYVLALKGNQGTLHQEVQSFWDDAQKRQWKRVAYGHTETVEKDHGRIERRRYWVTEAIDWLADKPQWEKLRSVGLVEATREVQGRVTTQRRYYLSSLGADAKQFARAVRGHWGIENSLHWVLDVPMNEDQCRVREKAAAQNLATLRALCLNLLRQDQTYKRGVKGKQKAAGWNPHYLVSLLNF